MYKIILLLLIIVFPFLIQAQKYVMVWNDEFNSTGLPDSTKWSYESGKIRNNELQYYTVNRLENARIEDSVLIIEARKEKYNGADYTSASIISKGIGDWKYGKIEISAKVPTGKGTWPALWMMPTNSEYGTWPRSGEIDIMEYVGFDPQFLYYTCHFEGTNGTGHQSSGTKSASISNPFNKFIKFAIIWTPDKIEWYANDVKYLTYTKKSDDYRTWPFNKEFYLILNLAYGGSWGASAGIDDTKLPHKFLIDYVRVYQWQETEGPFSISVQSTKHGKVEISPVMDLYPENTEVTVTAIPDSGYQLKAWEYQGRANPYTFIVNRNVVLNPLFYNPKNLIINGEFDLSYSKWDFYNYNTQTVNFSPSVVDSTFVFDITKSSGTDWHAGFQQLGLSLEKAEYKLTFEASAEQAKTLLITVSKNYGDWGAHLSKYINLTTTRKKYEVLLNMPSADNNVRLYFGTGKFSGKLWFDDISLTKVEKSTGISDLEENSNYFTVYPNPSTGKFRVKITGEKLYTESKLEMFSVDGKPIFTRILKENDSEIDPGKLQPGFYFLKITSEGNSYSKSLIIQ